MRVLLALLFFVSTFADYAHAAAGDSLISHVAIAKSKQHKDRFVFSVCHAQRCERLGSEQGYTAEQIEKFNGGLQMLGATAMGVGEGVVVLYLAGSGIAIGAGYMSFGALVGGGVAGAAIPMTAIHYIKSINPFEKFRNGSAKSKMENALEEMIESGDASVVIYKNPDLKKTLRFAKRVDNILNNL